MKKFFSIVLALAMVVGLLGCLGGCEKEQKPLRVLIDLGVGVDFLEDNVEDPILREAVRALTEEMVKDGIPEDTEFEIIPSTGSDRSSALTRIRAEMMAGTGPDVFIVGQSEATSSSNESLFLMPEKSMTLGLFYPLDDLIANNTQYMDWDDLNQTIMAAGYDEEYGQVLIPLGYEMPITLFMASEVDHMPSAEYTWADALNDESGVLAAASKIVRNDGGLSGSEVLGKLADYREKKLTFTEEDLFQLIDDMAQLDRNMGDNTYKNMPAFYRTLTTSALAYEFPDPTNVIYRGWYFGKGKFDEDYFAYNYFLDEVNRFKDERETDVTMVPAYNMTGGTTATIRFFAAINATCKRPEDAFKVIDYLFNEKYMQAPEDSSFLEDIQSAEDIQIVEDDQFLEDTETVENIQPWEVYSFIYRNTIPVQESLITGDIHAARGLELSPGNAQALLRATEAITVVRFADTLEIELNQLLLFGVLDKLGMLDTPGYEKNMAELVPATYTRMKRELSE